MLKVLTVILFGAALVGTIAFKSDPRIIGGITASPGQFPFIVSLRTGADTHLCGGTLIRRDWVLTAAHCVTNETILPFSVVAGTSQLNSTTGIRSTIEDIIVHPQFNLTPVENDIALLKLLTPIHESDFVSLIKLESHDIDVVRNVILAGWGSTTYPNLSSSNDLQFLGLKIVMYDSCTVEYAPRLILKSQICAFTNVGQGACIGDSGSPLIIIVKGQLRLVGFLSWGQPCAVGKPDVYTRVSSFVGWIKSEICNYYTTDL